MKAIWWMAMAMVAGEAAAQTVPLRPVQPSPWWAAERFGRGLPEGLTPSLEADTVVFRLERAAWNDLDYVQRYALVKHLGSTVPPTGGRLQVRDRQNTLLVESRAVNGEWAIAPIDLQAPPFRPHLLPAPTKTVQ
ncbi:MAG: hypothetical protein HC918_06415 [Oscillatoriales cyanobacterium SM2_1_8]|nr:hypothetical protein [Oscillatoriales cyanobacterium SM2_1_8]